MQISYNTKYYNDYNYGYVLLQLQLLLEGLIVFLVRIRMMTYKR